MELKKFNEKINNIIDLYLKINDIADKIDENTTKENINKSLEVLRKDNFNMVVVGEFSRGKSTFINALLGERVLPSATKPTTTVINKISYSSEEKYTIYFRDNREPKSISKEQFKDIVARVEPDFDDEDEIKEYNENLKLLGEIAYVNINYNSEICHEGIDIVDTPGTNDLDQAREEITFEFIPKSDVAILLLSANQILSESEISFLNERILANDIKKIFFVINFKDRLYSQEDEEKVFNYAKEHLQRIVENPRIYMVSAKGALNYKRKANGEIFKGKVPQTLEETGFIDFERDITEYLVNEKGIDKLKKYISRGIRLSNELEKNYIDTSISTIGIDTKILEKKINEFMPIIQKTKNESTLIINKLKTALISLEENLIYKYKVGLETIAINANIAINNYDGELEENAIARKIESVVAPIQKELQYSILQYKEEKIQNEINNTIQKLQDVWEDIDFNFNRALVALNTNKDMAVIDNLNTNCNANSDLDLLGGFFAGGAIIAAFNLPLIVIPAMIFGGKHFMNMFQERKRQNLLSEIRRQVERRYTDIIPQQIDQFRNNYRENTEMIVNALNEKVNYKINSLDEQLKKLLMDRREAKENDETQLKKLNDLKHQLQTINRELEGIL